MSGYPKRVRNTKMLSTNKDVVWTLSESPDDWELFKIVDGKLSFKVAPVYDTGDGVNDTRTYNHTANLYIMSVIATDASSNESMAGVNIRIEGTGRLSKVGLRIGL
jgi:hypothetical protein